MKDAITKINEEMKKNSKNSYIQAVGNFLLQHVGKHPQDAEKIMNKDKTIAKSLDVMRKEAEKKKVGSCAVLTDQEGFAVVLKYFDIVTEITQNVTESHKIVTSSIDFDVKLDDFM